MILYSISRLGRRSTLRVCIRDVERLMRVMKDEGHHGFRLRSERPLGFTTPQYQKAFWHADRSALLFNFQENVKRHWPRAAARDQFESTFLDHRFAK